MQILNDYTAAKRTCSLNIKYLLPAKGTPAQLKYSMASSHQRKLPRSLKVKKGPLVQRGLSVKRSETDWGIEIAIILDNL